MKVPRNRLFAALVLGLAAWATARAQAPGAPAPRPAARAAPPSAARGPLVLQWAPGGDTVALVTAEAPVEVVGREGPWTRVRVEGWTRSPVVGASVTGTLTPSALRAEPQAHRGARVTWSARFLAVQRADELRTDFSPGELFVLAREPNGEPGFVYVAVSPEQALGVKRLLPLQRFTFVGRVRTGASAQMGHPVLELVELRP